MAAVAGSKWKEATGAALFLSMLLTTLPVVFCDKAPPDIVFFFADDLGWDDPSFHGSSQIPTPNLDALAADGVILNKFYVEPACTPSRSAFMTGRYPIRMGTQGYPVDIGQPWGLPLDIRILPQYLQDLGYETHLVGKWHLGSCMKSLTPPQRGFDSFYGFYYGEEDYYSHNATYEDHTGLDFWFNDEPRWRDSGKYSTTLFTERAQEIIRNRRKPLFLYVAYQAPHGSGGIDPLQAPARNVMKFPYIGEEKRTLFAGGDVSSLDNVDGLDMWDYLSNGTGSARTELVYNINPLEPEGSSVAAIRDTQYKLVLDATGADSERYRTTGGRRPFNDVDELMAQSTATEALRKFYNTDRLDLPSDWRHRARLTCGKDATEHFSPDDKVFLFDIEKDPCELNNIAEDHPEIVAALKKRLDYFRSVASPPLNKPVDPQSFPENHDGTWAPWIQDP